MKRRHQAKVLICPILLMIKYLHVVTITLSCTWSKCYANYCIANMVNMISAHIRICEHATLATNQNAGFKETLMSFLDILVSILQTSIFLRKRRKFLTRRIHLCLFTIRVPVRRQVHSVQQQARVHHWILGLFVSVCLCTV